MEEVGSVLVLANATSVSIVVFTFSILFTTFHILETVKQVTYYALWELAPSVFSSYQSVRTAQISSVGGFPISEKKRMSTNLVRVIKHLAT